MFIATQVFQQINYTKNKATEQKAIEEFFVTTTNIQANDSQTLSAKKTNYIAVLEIPAISLKKGLVSSNSKYNNIKYNIEILKNSIEANELKDVYLAAHSGNSKVSFFKDLYRLNISDEVYLYYKKIKYKYIVDEIIDQKKDGTIIIPEKKEKRLILTTCAKNKERQILVICKLIEEIK